MMGRFRAHQHVLDHEQLQAFFNNPTETTLDCFCENEKEVSPLSQSHADRIKIQETYILYTVKAKHNDVHQKDTQCSPYLKQLRVDFQQYYTDNITSTITSNTLCQIPVKAIPANDTSSTVQHTLPTEFEYLQSVPKKEGSTDSLCHYYHSDTHNMLLFAIPDIATAKKRLDGEHGMFKPFQFMQDELRTAYNEKIPKERQKAFLKSIKYRNIHFVVYPFTIVDDELQPIYSWRDITVPQAEMLKQFDTQYRDMLTNHYANLPIFNLKNVNSAQALSNYFTAYVEHPSITDQCFCFSYEFTNPYSKTIQASWRFFNLMFLRQMLNRIVITNGQYCKITKDVFVNYSVFKKYYLPYIQRLDQYKLVGLMKVENLSCETFFQFLDCFKFKLLIESANRPNTIQTKVNNSQLSVVNMLNIMINALGLTNTPVSGLVTIMNLRKQVNLIKTHDWNKLHSKLVFGYLSLLYENENTDSTTTDTQDYCERSKALFHNKTVQELIDANKTDIKHATQLDMSYERFLDIYYWEYIYDRVTDYEDRQKITETRARILINRNSRRQNKQRLTTDDSLHKKWPRGETVKGGNRRTIVVKSSKQVVKAKGGYRKTRVRRRFRGQQVRQTKRAEHTEQERNGLRSKRYRRNRMNKTIGGAPPVVYTSSPLEQNNNKFPAETGRKNKSAYLQEGMKVDAVQMSRFIIKRVYDSYIHWKSVVVVQDDTQQTERVIHVNFHDNDTLNEKCKGQVEELYRAGSNTYGFAAFKPVNIDEKNTFQKVDIQSYYQGFNRYDDDSQVYFDMGVEDKQVDVRKESDLKEGNSPYIERILKGTQNIWADVFTNQSDEIKREERHRVLRRVFPISDDRCTCVVPSEDVSLSTETDVSAFYDAFCKYESDNTPVDLKHKYTRLLGWHLPVEHRQFYSRTPYGNIIPLRCMKHYVYNDDTKSQQFEIDVNNIIQKQGYTIDATENTLIAANYTLKNKDSLLQTYVLLNRVFQYLGIMPNSSAVHALSTANMPHHRMECPEVKRLSGWRNKRLYNHTANMHGRVNTYNPKTRVSYTMLLVELLSKAEMKELYNDQFKEDTNHLFFDNCMFA